MKDLDARIEIRQLNDRVRELEKVVRALLKQLSLEIELCAGLHLIKEVKP